MSCKEKNGPEEVFPWEKKLTPTDSVDMSIDLGLPKDISRQCFREPIGPEENITAKLNNQNYPVIDIGSRGIGVALPSPQELKKGQELDIAITLDGKLIHFRGKVVHISQEATEKQYHCGIEFLDLSAETEKQLQEFIQKHHAELFGQPPGFL